MKYTRAIKDVFMDLAPCSTNTTRRFGERTVSIFRVPQRFRDNTTVETSRTFKEPLKWRLRSPKRRVELLLHGTKSMKTFLIDSHESSTEDSGLPRLIILGLV
jgi:hypothetical protein